MIEHVFAIIGATLTWLLINIFVLFWRDEYCQLGCKIGEACLCGKHFVPKPFRSFVSKGEESPEVTWKSTIGSIAMIAFVIPIFVPQEVVRRYFHHRSCLVWQVDQV